VLVQERAKAELGTRRRLPGAAAGQPRPPAALQHVVGTQLLVGRPAVVLHRRGPLPRAAPRRRQRKGLVVEEKSCASP